jgi:hypothetical protein
MTPHAIEFGPLDERAGSVELRHNFLAGIHENESMCCIGLYVAGVIFAAHVCADRSDEMQIASLKGIDALYVSGDPFGLTSSGSRRGNHC